MSGLDRVIDQMQGHGLPMLPHGHPILDGKIHRFGPKKKAWYLLREVDTRGGDTLIGGAFGVWQGASNNAVAVQMDWSGISAEDRAAAEQKQREFEAREAEKRRRLAENAANRARLQWEGAAAEGQSPYLARKQVTPEGVRFFGDGTVLVPMVRYAEAGPQLVGLQKIAPDGEKRFNAGMEKSGAACKLGKIARHEPLVTIAEGYATARSVRMALEDRVPGLVAFDAGNLLPVAMALRASHPETHILFVADDDWQLEKRFVDRLAEDFKVLAPVAIDGVEQMLRADDGATVSVTASWKEDACGVRFIEADVRSGRVMRTFKFENAGVAKAMAAAAAVGNASVVVPQFAARGENKWTDFNDLHVEQSLTDVAGQITLAINAAHAKPKLPALSLVKNPPLPPVDEMHPAFAGDVAPAPAEGGEGKKRKPKKEFPQEFWDKVDELRSRFVLIYGDDTAWDSYHRMIIRINHMRLAFSNDAVKFWLNSPGRRMVTKDCVVFDPTLKADLDTHVNLFDGFKMQPKEGSCDKILELLLHLCNGNAEVMAWVLRWIAYPLQNPGAKMRTSVIIHGDEGSGKNLFWENVVARIYGEYGGVIGNAQIESQFNEWASKKLFFVADEVVTRNELRQLKGKLKHMVTGEVIMINPKGMTERAEANHMNFVFLSNELQPLALDKTDRRYLVLWTPPKREESFYKEVSRQIDQGGVEAFYHYLMNSVPCDDFNEHSKPLETEAKTKLIGLGLAPPERFYREWRGGFLPLPYVCCSAQQLYLAFCRWIHLNGERFPMTQAMFGRTIERTSFADGVRRAVIKYELLTDGIKQRTVYLVGEQPEGRNRSDWVEDASQLFENALKKYRHVYEQTDDIPGAS